MGHEQVAYSRSSILWIPLDVRIVSKTEFADRRPHGHLRLIRTCELCAHHGIRTHTVSLLKTVPPAKLG